MSFEVVKRPVISDDVSKRSGQRYHNGGDVSRVAKIDRELQNSLHVIEDISLYRLPKYTYKINQHSELVRDHNHFNNKKKVLVCADYLRSVNEENCIDMKISDGSVDTNEILNVFIKDNHEKLSENIVALQKSCYKNKTLATSELEETRKETLSISDQMRKIAPFHSPNDDISFDTIFGKSMNDKENPNDKSFHDGHEYYFDAETSRFVNRKNPPIKKDDISKRLDHDLNELDKSLYKDLFKTSKHSKTRETGRKDIRHMGLNHYELLKLISNKKQESSNNKQKVESSTHKATTNKDTEETTEQMPSDDWDVLLQKRSLKFDSAIRNSETFSNPLKRTNVANKSTASSPSKQLFATTATIPHSSSTTSKLKDSTPLSPSVPNTRPNSKHIHDQQHANPMRRRIRISDTTITVPVIVEEESTSVTAKEGEVDDNDEDNDEQEVRRPETVESQMEQLHEKEQKHNITTVYFVSSVGAVATKKLVDQDASLNSVPFRSSETRSVGKRTALYKNRADRGYTAAVTKQVVREMKDKEESKALFENTNGGEYMNPIPAKAIKIRKAMQNDIQSFNEIVVKLSRKSVINTTRLIENWESLVDHKEERMKKHLKQLEKQAYKRSSFRGGKDITSDQSSVEEDDELSSYTASVLPAVFMTQPNA